MSEDHNPALPDAFTPPCEDSRHHELSPSGEWHLSYCGKDKQSKWILQNKDGKLWEVKVADLFAKYLLESNPMLPEDRFYEQRWTPDEHYLYFTYSPGGPDGGDDFCSYGNGWDGLFRIDLTNGKVGKLLDAPFFEFSPDGRKIAYASWGSVGILDMDTGLNTVLANNRNLGRFGDLVWSNDSSELVYSQCRNGDEVWIVDTSSIMFYSLSSKKLNTLMMAQGEKLVCSHTENPGIILISKIDYQLYFSQDYYYDWNTIWQITPTPEG